MALVITGGTVLVQETWESRPVRIEGSVVAEASGKASLPQTGDMMLDATGLVVLPGIVDTHGDGFERQISPRPGVAFPLELALLDTDRQLVSNGITTACHAVTCSWEPGLRSLESAGQILEAVEAMRSRLVVDTHFHLRHETFNLDAEDLLAQWIRAGRIAVLAFNDHMEGIIRTKGQKASKLARTVERTGLTHEAFMEMADEFWARASEVPPSIARLAEVAREARIAILSHDDRSIDDRESFRSMGSAVSEFPMTEAVAADAIAKGEHVVFGAPNVVRGGSHTGCPSAREMVAKGLCTILASDYFYPSLPEAVQCLDRLGILEFAKAWSLVSRNPAQALGLVDRGEIMPGKRADLLLARRDARGLAIVATIIAGRIVMLTEPERHSQPVAQAA